MSPKQLPTTNSNVDRQWRVARYVLGDPTLDRQVFEASMAEDIELALAVADCVEQLQGLSQACRSSSMVAASLPSRPPRPAAAGLALRVKRWAVTTAGLAAALLVSFFAWHNSRSPREIAALTQPAASRGGELRLAEVAQQWLVMDTMPIDHGWLPTETSGLLNELAANEINEPDVGRAEFEAHAQATMTDENDWMLQVSAAFFEESDS